MKFFYLIITLKVECGWFDKSLIIISVDYIDFRLWYHISRKILLNFIKLIFKIKIILYLYIII